MDYTELLEKAVLANKKVYEAKLIYEELLEKTKKAEDIFNRLKGKASIVTNMLTSAIEKESKGLNLMNYDDYYYEEEDEDV